MLRGGTVSELASKGAHSLHPLFIIIETFEAEVFFRQSSSGKGCRAYVCLGCEQTARPKKKAPRNSTGPSSA
jgi:hypothetical protein